VVVMMMVIITLEEFDRAVLVRKVQVDCNRILYFQRFF
jgi:hypothetical protein